MSNKLSFARGQAYLGTNAPQPPNWNFENRPPTQYDNQNYSLGDLWLDQSESGVQRIWVLVSLQGDVNSKGVLAEWVQLGGGDLETLSGDSGINPVFPDINNNINVFGDLAVGLTVSGDGVNTLTITTVSGQALLQSLTGDVGGAVFPDVNQNINLLGTGGEIIVSGNPATNTLTWVLDGSVAQSFPTDNGIATPSFNVLNILAQNATLGCGSSVLFSAPAPGDTVQLNVTDANDNTIIGNDAGNLTIAGTNSVVLGEAAATDLTTSSNNVIVGRRAAQNITSGGSHVIIGSSAGSNLTTTDNNNIFIGNSAGIAGEEGTIRIGNTSGGSSTNNIFIGPQSGNTTYTLASAVSNIGIGINSLNAVTTGNGNLAVGVNTLRFLTTGIQNTVFSAGENITTGSDNTFVGYLAGSGITTGDENVFIGQSAGGQCTLGDSHNICISDGGQPGDNFTMRLGNGLLPLQRVFIGGIRGVTTGVADAINVLIDSAGQLGTISSSARYKQNIKDLNHDSEIIYDLRPVSFNYKKHPDAPAWGLIAEEVSQVFPQLVVYDKDDEPESVKYHDLPVLLLNEIQKLKKRIEDLEEQLEN